MLDLLWLVPTLPLLGFLILALGQGRARQAVVAWVGVGSIGLAAVVAAIVGIDFILAPPPQGAYVQPLWEWMNIDGFTPQLGLYLDPLSVVMMWVVTGVGFFIHLYSTDYMLGDEGYARFFAYMNLFVAAMLVLVLGDNLLFLYLGWEGVGLASYLLIGFWYLDPGNGAAARKAFVITRVGDTAFAIGLFLIFVNLNTLDIQTVLQQAEANWAVGSTLAIAAAALLLGGAVGKSAQLPLHTWLPDAMAGPTPVSALIHAATMVTAGVYLIARMHPLFEIAPVVQYAVAIIGALGLLIAGFTALVAYDIKRILAYSTMAQIGYMFLALGVGAWSAAIFHLMTHAFFKALLFLSAGAVILALHHEQNIFKMGGLYKRMPGTFWAFLIGAAALSALPLITSGFFSKDLILWNAWASPQGGPWLWAAGLLGAFLTGVYTFRLIFIVFFGEAKTEVTWRPGPRIMIPLGVLAVLSIAGGWIELPPTLGNMPVFSEFMAGALPASEAHGEFASELTMQIIASVVSLAGIAVAWVLFLRYTPLLNAITRQRFSKPLAQFWYSGFGFDWVYDRIFVKPFAWIAHINRDDIVDAFYRGTALLAQFLHYMLSWTQTGAVRLYAAGVAAGVIVTIAITVFVT